MTTADLLRLAIAWTAVAIAVAALTQARRNAREARQHARHARQMERQAWGDAARSELARMKIRQLRSPRPTTMKPTAPKEQP